MKKRDTTVQSGKAATLEELVETATEIKQLTADEQWRQTLGGREGLMARVLHFGIAIISIEAPKRKQTLARRLARAEAQRLLGSCNAFERSVRRIPYWQAELLSEPDAKAADDAAEDLFVAVSVFLEMAREV